MNEKGRLETSLRKASSVCKWTSSSWLTVQPCVDKKRVVALVLQKASVSHVAAGQNVDFILIFYGKGEHSELTCKL